MATMRPPVSRSRSGRGGEREQAESIYALGQLADGGSAVAPRVRTYNVEPPSPSGGGGGGGGDNGRVAPTPKIRMHADSSQVCAHGMEASFFVCVVLLV